MPSLETLMLDWCLHLDISFQNAGMLNVHASLLPRWRGAAPIIYAILNGDSETGVTIMQIKPRKFDIGNIVLQERCPIAPTDTAPVLKERLAELGSKLLQETLKDLPRCLHESVPQPESGVTYGMSYERN
ncbi:methionyl-tRNA formyltransferase, mitochondrial isoform X2 [Zootermopsis nevadensis]|uniref:methionyl-tRNA formyltransferase, mitochondrial isoform X2 n=1 Tax=Zootermopsis nevadensis TaxID=136037 RepID=UPI000B8E431F|nr:methionyl-tRNA formyltransferase, mitochondrial isoform X2 [Zootermopsis nevadensis]